MMHFVLPPGTGRALEIIKRRWPGATVVGVEPVEAMRKVGHEKGIPERELIGGDALNLPFEDDSFDFVIETGVLHHIKTPLKAVTFDAPPEGTQTRS
jgi:ubiquinone/menaquinone biosynthesis C-methylase UbiE